MKFALLALAATLVSAFNVRVDLRGHSDIKYHKTVKLDVGSRFILVLDENQSTGYSWQVVESYLLMNGLYSVL